MKATNTEKLKALLTISGIPHDKIWLIQNKYWPTSLHEVREENPWLLVRTPYGMLEIGWRKKVISIDWKDTGFNFLITEDDVTKDATMVHAWGYVKAVEYLSELALRLLEHDE